MRIIGVIGGVASGKSTVARLFERLGAGVLDADRAGHEALRLTQVEAAAKKRWGNEIFGPDGRIDRAKLARRVFAPGTAGHKERLYLEQLTHPEIARLLHRQADEMAAAGTAGAASIAGIPIARAQAPIKLSLGHNSPPSSPNRSAGSAGDTQSGGGVSPRRGAATVPEPRRGGTVMPSICAAANEGT